MHNFVGYGSLLSHKSLKDTIPDKKFTPVIVNGYRRIFNIPVESNAQTDALNLKKDSKASFNGVLFQINDKELEKLKLREAEYNLEKVWAYDFSTRKKLCECFISIDYYVALDKMRLSPNREYFKLCREAAFHISEEFGRYWDETTFTAKGEKISLWLKKNKRYLR